MSAQPAAGCDGTAPLSQQQVLGEEHPDTLISMNNLAICLKKQSKHSEAEALYRQALAAQQKVGLAGVVWVRILPCDRRCRSASCTSRACAKQLAISCMRVGVEKEGLDGHQL